MGLIYIKSIVIALPNFICNDAIGNDVLAQYEILNRKGVKVKIFAEIYEQKLDSLVCGIREAKKADVIIYHHSINWKWGQKLLSKHAGHVRAMRYHNITPGRYFENYCNEMAEISFKGRSQTTEIINLCTHYWPASDYNKEELIKAGADPLKCKVLTPFHNIDELVSLKNKECSLDWIKSIKKPIILFVGRQVPNKGVHHFIKIAGEYVKLYGKNAYFVWVGARDLKLYGYYKENQQLIYNNRLADVVLFPGKVSFDELRSYYTRSDIFLCVSEHEGFCVPIIEAQALGIPVIALNRTAVGGTLGENQILFNDLDYEKFAAAIHVLLNNAPYKTYLAEQGRSNFENRFKGQTLESEFVREIEYKIN